MPHKAFFIVILTFGLGKGKRFGERRLGQSATVFFFFFFSLRGDRDRDCDLVEDCTCWLACDCEASLWTGDQAELEEELKGE
jgi:hypothetical protein